LKVEHQDGAGGYLHIVSGKGGKTALLSTKAIYLQFLRKKVISNVLAPIIIIY
jgi:hypothetical protein